MDFRQIDPKRLEKISESASLFLHTPAESSAAYIKSVEETITEPGIDYGCKSLNSAFTPMRGGEVTSILARPGHGKTSYLTYLARYHARKLEARGETNKVVLYVTWEEPVESIEMSIQSGRDYTAESVAWGTVDVDLVRRNATSRGSLPLVVIGNSLIRNKKKRVPLMTVERVIDTIQALYIDFDVEPVLILADHLHEIPVERGRNRIEEIGEALHRLKALSFAVNAPIVLGVQATRDVDNQGLPLPTMDTGQWSSVIEQVSYREIGLLRPAAISSRAGDVAKTIDIKNVGLFTVNKNLFIMRLIKQRKYFPPKSIYPLHFKPDYLELYDIDSITQQPIAYSPNDGETIVRREARL
jgi:replicative DNA helicase